MTTYVAGGSGLVGSAVCRRLQADGVEVSAERVDLYDIHKCRQFFGGGNFERIIFCAGDVGGIGKNRLRGYRMCVNNLHLIINLFDSIPPDTHVVYLGSTCMYPWRKHSASESDLQEGKPEPSNEGYALAKIVGEYLTRQKGGFTLIPTNMYGPHDNFDPNTGHAVASILWKIHQAHTKGESSVTLWGTGFPVRDFLYVDDFADALQHMLRLHDHVRPKAINIGTGKPTSIRDLARLIAKVVGYKGAIVFDGRISHEGSPAKVTNCSTAKGFGWEAKTGLREGLECTYEWFKSNA